jgi:hypothetical protein
VNRSAEGSAEECILNSLHFTNTVLVILSLRLAALGCGLWDSRLVIMFAHIL